MIDCDSDFFADQLHVLVCQRGIAFAEAVMLCINQRIRFFADI
jgi:hypothetical protein